MQCLGAGILSGGNPKDFKSMRKAGASFFYDQQKKFKRIYDLVNASKQTKIKKRVEVLEIFPKLLDEYWNLVDFMLREGLKYDGEPMSISDLKKLIKEGQMQLFVMFGSDDECTVQSIWCLCYTNHGSS